MHLMSLVWPRVFVLAAQKRFLWNVTRSQEPKILKAYGGRSSQLRPLNNNGIQERIYVYASSQVRIALASNWENFNTQLHIWWSWDFVNWTLQTDMTTWNISGTVTLILKGVWTNSSYARGIHQRFWMRDVKLEAGASEYCQRIMANWLRRTEWVPKRMILAWSSGKKSLASLASDLVHICLYFDTAAPSFDYCTL